PSVSLLRGEEGGRAGRLAPAGPAQVATATFLHAVVEGRVARPEDVEERVCAAVVQVRSRVPEIVQHRRDVFREPPPARGNGPRVGWIPGILEGLVLHRDGERVGLVEQVRRAHVVPDERVVLVGSARPRRIEPGKVRLLVGEELPSGSGTTDVTGGALRGGIVEDAAAALHGWRRRVRVSRE